MLRVGYNQLLDFMTALFNKSGLSIEQSHTVAEVLAVTEAKGVYSHGAGLVKVYVRQLLEGRINKNPQIKIMRETPATMLLDCDNGIGAVVAKRAAELAIEKAKAVGAAFISCKNVNHYGAGLYYVDMAAKQNMIAYLYANANPCMAPWGGTKKLLGTNPYTYGAPAGKYSPYILDFATTVVAANKIIQLNQAGENVPEGWGLDENGMPTTDGVKIMKSGSMCPFGGVKGYGMSGMVNITAGILSGSAYGYDVHCLPDEKSPANFGFCMQVIDIGAFEDVDEFNSKMESFIELIKNTPRREGVDEIYYPGDIEGKKLERAKLEGFVISDYAVDSLKTAAEDVGLNMSEYLNEAAE